MCRMPLILLILSIETQHLTFLRLSFWKMCLFCFPSWNCIKEHPCWRVGKRGERNWRDFSESKASYSRVHGNSLTFSRRFSSIGVGRERCRQRFANVRVSGRDGVVNTLTDFVFFRKAHSKSHRFSTRYCYGAITGSTNRKLFRTKRLISYDKQWVKTVLSFKINGRQLFLSNGRGIIINIRSL